MRAKEGNKQIAVQHSIAIGTPCTMVLSSRNLLFVFQQHTHNPQRTSLRPEIIVHTSITYTDRATDLSPERCAGELPLELGTGVIHDRGRGPLACGSGEPRGRAVVRDIGDGGVDDILSRGNRQAVR